MVAFEHLTPDGRSTSSIGTSIVLVSISAVYGRLSTSSPDGRSSSPAEASVNACSYLSGS